MTVVVELTVVVSHAGGAVVGIVVVVVVGLTVSFIVEVVFSGFSGLSLGSLSFGQFATHSLLLLEHDEWSSLYTGLFLSVPEFGLSDPVFVPGPVFDPGPDPGPPPMCSAIAINDDIIKDAMIKTTASKIRTFFFFVFIFLPPV
jgi:hypothetical protein